MEDFKIVFGYKAKLWALAVVIAYIYIMRLQMTRHTQLWEDLAEKNMSLWENNQTIPIYHDEITNVRIKGQEIYVNEIL